MAVIDQTVLFGFSYVNHLLDYCCITMSLVHFRLFCDRVTIAFDALSFSLFFVSLSLSLSLPSSISHSQCTHLWPSSPAMLRVGCATSVTRAVNLTLPTRHPQHRYVNLTHGSLRTVTAWPLSRSLRCL